jgi:ABC-2 type transport system permease protein
MNTPLRWSVRRELWENRSIYVAPLVVATVFLFGFLISTIGMPHRRRAVLLLDPAKQRAVIGQPYDAAAMMLIVTAFVVGAFYCLDALHGERRDRSILFWKSLPVSDRTTVISKASIPLVVLPLIIFAIVVTTQLMMLLWSSVILLPSGLAGTTWTRFNLLQESFILLYGLIVLALWHAPVYGWLLLVSAWARRATILWAVLPPFAIGVLEKVAFNTTIFGFALKYRLISGLDEAFAFKKDGTVVSLSQLTPLNFLSSPGLWTGLAFAALFLAGAVRLRRYREPI